MVVGRVNQPYPLSFLIDRTGIMCAGVGNVNGKSSDEYTYRGEIVEYQCNEDKCGETEVSKFYIDTTLLVASRYSVDENFNVRCNMRINVIALHSLNFLESQRSTDKKLICRIQWRSNILFFLNFLLTTNQGLNIQRVKLHRVDKETSSELRRPVLTSTKRWFKKRKKSECNETPV